METINSGMLVNAPPAPAPAPNSGSNNSGKTIAIVVLVILLLLVIGYLFMSQGGSGTDETVAIGTNFEYGEGIDDISFTENPQRSVTKDELAREDLLKKQEIAYIGYHTRQGNPPELNEDGSLVSDVVRGPTLPDPPKETIKIGEGGSETLSVSSSENYMIMPNLPASVSEYQTYAYNPNDTDVNGSKLTFDVSENKCPDGTLDCLYYETVENGRVVDIVDKNGNKLIKRIMDDLWNGKLEHIDELYFKMKHLKLNENNELMKKTGTGEYVKIKPGVDISVGQFILLFGVMYKNTTDKLAPNIILDFPAKKNETKTTPDTPDVETKTTPDTPDVETKTTSETIDNVPITPLSNIRSKVTFITSKEEALSATSLLNVRERITFATPT